MCVIKLKKKLYVGSITKSNIEIVEKGKIDTPRPHILDYTLSCTFVSK